MDANTRMALDLLESFTSSVSPQVAGSSIAKALGFTWFNYENSRTVKSITNGPHGWSECYRKRNYISVDPIRLLTRKTQRTTAWSRRSPDLRRDRNTSLFIEESSQFGAACGINIPIPAGFGRESFLSFSNANDEIPDPAILQSPLIYVLATRLDIFFSSIRQERGDHISLTPQESLCLTWASKGKGMAETAAILGIQRRTVEFHLANARSKLGTVTATQTVAEAIRRGLIE